MKKILFAVLMTFLLYGSTFSQVTADWDKSIDFSKYSTYSFAGWQKDSEKVLNDIDKKTLLDALQAEFTKRNMTYVEDNGDAVVTLYIVVDNKTSLTAYTDYNGGMGMGYGAARWGYGMGSATTSYSEDDYQQGTLVVDLYDGSTKKLSWQGTSQSTVNANASKRDKTIPKKVNKLMKKYPVDPTK